MASTQMCTLASCKDVHPNTPPPQLFPLALHALALRSPRHTTTHTSLATHSSAQTNRPPCKTDQSSTQYRPAPKPAVKHQESAGQWLVPPVCTPTHCGQTSPLAPQQTTFPSNQHKHSRWLPSSCCVSCSFLIQQQATTDAAALAAGWLAGAPPSREYLVCGRHWPNTSDELPRPAPLLCWPYAVPVTVG